MKLSPQGIAAIAGHEAFVPGPYFDTKRVLTIFVGHTAAAGDPDPAARPRGMPDDLDAALAEGLAVFARDLARFEAEVSRAIRVEVTQAEFDAAVSFHFNTGAIGRADWVKALNAGNLAGAAAGIMNWRKPPEIIDRREAEQRLFQTGAYPNKAMNVWSVDEAGRISWKKPVRVVQPAELLAMIEEARPAPLISQPMPRPAPDAAPETDDAEAIAWAEWINTAPPGVLAWLREMPVREGRA